MRDFKSLSEREILALAIFLEEEDERIYADLAEGLRGNFPASAEVFDGMREEESGHRRRLIELFRQKFGEHIPLVRRRRPDRQVVRRWTFPVPVKTRIQIFRGPGVQPWRCWPADPTSPSPEPPPSSAGRTTTTARHCRRTAEQACH